MKKLLSLLFATATFGLAAQNTISIQVDDGNIPHSGVAVFLYESALSFSWGSVNDPTTFTQVGYTDVNGVVVFTLASTTDSVFFGTFDCGGQFYQDYNFSVPSNPSIVDTLVNPGCTPTDCQALLVSNSTAAGLGVEAFSLRDVAFINPGGAITHTFRANGGSTLYGSTANYNYSMVTFPPSVLPSGGGVVYLEYLRMDTVCSPQVDSVYFPGGGPTLTCSASYFIDTVNTGTFQGQLVLGENSTTSSGSIIDWSWDFGDGTVYNTQYPIHTYASVAASYTVCLTITAVDGMDTCMSTYCDTVQFDSTGAPVLKTGFTVNVLDPNTFSVEDPLLESIVMYPNPSHGEAQITWDNALDVKVIEVFNINGQQMMHVEPTENVLRFQNMPSGVFLLRIQTANAVVSRRLIVE